MKLETERDREEERAEGGGGAEKGKEEGGKDWGREEERKKETERLWICVLKYRKAFMGAVPWNPIWKRKR